MYRRPKFLEILIDIRLEMAHEADYDVDLFVETAKHSRPAAGRSAELLTETEAAVEDGDRVIK